MQIAGNLEGATASYVDAICSEARGISASYLTLVARRFVEEIDRNHGSIKDYVGEVATEIAALVRGRVFAFHAPQHDYCLDEDGHRILVNRAFVDKQIAAAVRGVDMAGLGSCADQRRMLREIVRTEVNLLLAHEIYHTQQGLPSIAAARKAISILGADEFSKFDVIADFRAAAVDAALCALREGKLSYEGVLDRFATNLAFTLRYNAPIFKAPADKLHKRARFASKVLQLARIASFRAQHLSVDRAAFRALTAPVFVVVPPDLRRLTVLALEPAQFLGTFDFEAGELAPFFDQLDSGNVDGLVREGTIVAEQIGFLDVP